MEHKINVLIFDDKVGNRYMLEVLLKGSGYAVYTADNGSDALKILKTEHIELVISDILMPVMDGFELCRKIRADKELCNIVFVVYTATYTGPQDEEFALKIGANLFIQKPCEPEIFMEAISNVLSASKGRVMDVSPHPQDEEVLKLYNERLVRELEQKMLQLEKEIRVRKNTEEILRQSQKMEVIGQLAGGNSS